MFRTDVATRSPDLFGAGRGGYTEGDPVHGPPATNTSADAFNAFQEEIARAVEASGQPLNKADYSQLARATRGFVEGNWSASQAGGAWDVYAACRIAGSAVIIGGAGGHVQVSPDGTDWSGAALQLNDGSGGHPDVLALAWKNNEIVAVGKSGALWWSTDGGATWTYNHQGSADLHAVIYDVAIGWVAVGATGILLQTNAPNTAWTTRNSHTTNNIWAVAYCQSGTLVATVDMPSAAAGVITSTDAGVTWTVPSLIAGATSPLRAACAAGFSNFLLGGAGGEMFSSINNWQAFTSGVTGNIRAVALSPGGVCLIVTESSEIASAVDGNFQRRASTRTESLNAIAWMGDGWAVGGAAQLVLNSLRV